MHGSSSIIKSQLTLAHYIEGLAHASISLKPRVPLIHVGDKPENIFLIRSGWLYRFQLLGDGRRQIFSFYTSGDLVKLGFLWAGQSHYSLAAITAGEALVISRQAIINAMSKNEELMDAVLQMISFQQRYADERMVELGRLSAYERVCVLIARLASRLDHMGEDTLVPLTRDLISDVLGITSVHTSRTLKLLEDQGVVRWNRQSLQVLNLQKVRDAVPRGFHVHSEVLPHLL